MSKTNPLNWQEANQQYLMAAVGLVQAELEAYQSGWDNSSWTEPQNRTGIIEAEELLAEASFRLPSPSSLETVVRVFGLSDFEKRILLVCAGVELSTSFAALIASLQGNSGQVLPSFSLAMAVFKEAHWTAISPASPLRYWRLIHLSDHQLLTRSPIRIDEQLLHYLTGINTIDERLREIVEPLPANGFLVPSQLALAQQAIRACNEKAALTRSFPLIVLNGDGADKAGIAGYISSSMERKLHVLSAYSIPVVKKDLTELIRLWNRESAINAYALLLDCSEIDAGDKSRLLNVQHFIQHLQGLFMISTSRWSPQIGREHINLDVSKPTRKEQNSLWQSMLGESVVHLNGQLDQLVSQFNLDAKTIQQVIAEINHDQQNGAVLPEHQVPALTKNLWGLCCKYSRPKMEELTQRIEPVAQWNDLVLPDLQMDILREITMQVKQRKKVYEDWGFASTNSRGLGISAMFTGESGTGKTMAAEVLANALKLDLYRIDLSQVVNKYIGETEKNLRRIFDACEEGGAILLFDEADALFGKRSEVKDSHDRYGNIEVSYLLQRMEAYRGLAILTTNMKNALDKAFLRRIRFVVQFPFPGISQRAEIWSKVFPADTPLGDLDLDKLSKLSLPGGNIRNIAMNAAFIAAEEHVPVGMSQVLRAARTEYNKLDKAMNSIDTDR